MTGTPQNTGPLAVDGRINAMRQTNQFTALNRKSSYDVSLAHHPKRNIFAAPRQTVQVGQPNIELDGLYKKFKSINQIIQEQEAMN